MKILTLNTHSWLEAHPLEKLTQLANHILKEEYGLIALQEINQRIESSPAVLDRFFILQKINSRFMKIISLIF